MAVEKQFPVGSGSFVEVLLSSATSKGVFSIMFETCPPKAGPPPHIHQFEDEYFIPIEGHFEIFDGEAWSPMPPSGAFGPRGRAHSWRNAGNTAGKLLVIASGNCFDKFLEEFGKLQLPSEMKKLIEMSAGYGISYIFDDSPTSFERTEP